MSVLKNLEPRDFFKFFEEISAIPRGSGNRKGITDYLVSFAAQRGLECIRDDYDNCIIKKPAQGGGASREAVIIQGHTDMVTVAEPGRNKDFINEGIKLLTDGEYVYADGTTLGADDGAAVCYALLVLDNKEITHPPIEAVFTTDEEIGLIGAGRLDTSILSGKTFFNIDSEDDGIFFAGCAGGGVCKVTKKYDKYHLKGMPLTLSLTHLSGGHSGMEIDKHRANAIKIMGDVAYKLILRFEGLDLISFNGGEKDNAIATFAEIKMLYEERDAAALETAFNELMGEALINYAKTDPEAVYAITPGNEQEEAFVISRKEAVETLKLITQIEDGVIELSNELENVVETSSNLGIINAGTEGCEITVSVRSLINDKRNEQISRIKTLAAGAFDTETSGLYSAWSYAPQSPARNILMEEYKRVTGRTPKLMVIHAGLECGVFAEKMSGVDFVSFGPQADDIHTYKERLSIRSVADYREILINTLKRLA